ncbi:aldehyde dehydrogenase family protein [Streptomyces phaeochromogenes]|uniref:aldehyde dehydrogenase family protein n=1 Tax=Streptomyces phaeochromogenes TaxID=1923 RepID=UPI00369192AD
MTTAVANEGTDTAGIPGSGDQPMLIDGERVPALSGRTIDVFNPSTGALIGTTPDGASADVDRAVAVAGRTFDERVWQGLSGAARQKILWRAADLIEQHATELATLESLNNGMVIPMANVLIATAAETIRYYAGWATKLYGVTSEISSPEAQFHSYTLREPVGVCALIIPWNAPSTLTVQKLAPALAAGCSVVIKPSEETPFTALRLAELFEEAGVPHGVINVVTGYGESAGAALAAHDKVSKIAFTGSTDVGKLIVKAAAGNLKKVTLELGGKSPVIVFDDADLDAAIAGAANAIFMHSGQICAAGSRLYVQRSVFDQVVDGIAEIAKGLKVGPGSDPTTQIGPIVSQKQLDRVLSLIASGIEEGAELVTGGERVGDQGYYVQPTILADPNPGARVIKEEIFGPVLTAIPFDDIDEVVAMANDTTYGLGAAIWTKDINKSHLTAKRLQAGFVWLNCHYVLDNSLPAGGYKQSGWGRELGAEGLDPYLQTKSVFAALTRAPFLNS